MSPNQAHQSPSKKYRSNYVVDALKNKVEEVIQLCQGSEDNIKYNAHLGEVVEV